MSVAFATHTFKSQIKQIDKPISIRNSKKTLNLFVTHLRKHGGLYSVWTKYCGMYFIHYFIQSSVLTIAL